MALPFGPYEGQDLTQYQAGNKFLPRQFYSLDFPNTPPPSIASTPTGITNTQAAGSYMGYPSYEAWLLAQGGGGGGKDDPVDNTNRGGINFNLGPTNITDYEADAYGVGPTWAGTWARAKDAYSNLPTPGNLIMKGIRHWKERRDIKRAEDQKAAADKAAADLAAARPSLQAQSQANKAAGTGGWQSGMAKDEGFMSGSGTSDDMGSFAQGGRIGYERGRVVNPGGYSGDTWRDFLASQAEWQIRPNDDWRTVYHRWLDSQKADGGIARLL
jgi:hypothetical protein